MAEETATATSAPEANEDELLEQVEVARILKVSVQTVRNLGERGELEYIRVGRQRRIRRSELDRYIAVQTTTRAVS